MRIETVRHAGTAQVRVEGRMDREWAEQLSAVLERLVQQGVRSLRLDLSELTYISSAGMEVLGRWYAELRSLRGELRLGAVPSSVQQALDAAGWALPDGTESATTVLTPRELRRSSWYLQSDLTTCGAYEHATLDRAGALRCRLHGDPARLGTGGFDTGDAVPFPAGSFGLGLGAIGHRWEEAAPHLGELVAVHGTIATFPTGGARLPDWFAPGNSGNVAPTGILATGLSCRGSFSHLVRFSARPEVEAVPVAELASVALDATGAKLAGAVIVAECAGMSGVRLRRSPRAGSAALRYEVPQVRDWLLLSPERIHPMTTIVAAGVVARSPHDPFAAHLRPLGPPRLMGHFHAAVFSYHPVPQRTVELPALLATLFGTRRLRDVLHLVADPRGAGALPDTECMRGVAWVGPIHEVEPA